MEKDSFQTKKDQFLYEYSKLFNPYENTKTFNLVLKNRILKRKLQRNQKTKRKNQKTHTERKRNQRSPKQHPNKHSSKVQNRIEEKATRS